MFIRLNRHLIDEVRELDAAGAQTRARVAKSAQKSVAVQDERLNMSVKLTVQIPRMVMWIVSLVCLPLFSLFSAFLIFVFLYVLGVRPFLTRNIFQEIFGLEDEKKSWQKKGFLRGVFSENITRQNIAQEKKARILPAEE